MSRPDPRRDGEAVLEPDDAGCDHKVIEPVDPRESEPDVNDGEAPQPMGGDDDLIPGR